MKGDGDEYRTTVIIRSAVTHLHALHGLNRAVVLGKAKASRSHGRGIREVKEQVSGGNVYEAATVSVEWIRSRQHIVSDK